MKRSVFIFAFFCLLLPALVKADVRVEGVVTRQFSISNIDKFAGYQFYYTYQSYRYDKGYRANPIDTLALEINKRYAAASRGNSRATLLAKNKEGKWIKANLLLGGEVNANPLMTGMVDVYEIVSIKKGVIKLKKIKEVALYKDGKEKEQKVSAGFFATLNNDKFASGLMIASIAALGGLLFLFFRRKKHPQYEVMTT